MPLIQSDHNLGGFAAAQSNNTNTGRSHYFYLFKDAANDKEAGRFPLSYGDEEDMITRLRDFATWIERINTALPKDDIKLRIKLPAAFAYFGQFLNHDLSAPVGSLLQIVDEIPEDFIISDKPLPGVTKMWRAATTDEIIDHIRNEHATPLHLDSLYGDGPFLPNGQPTSAEARALYDAQGLHFILGTTSEPSAEVLANAKNPLERAIGAPDLPRKRAGDAVVTLIADRRNDGNLILAQLHLALMLFHNKAVDILHPQYPDAAKCFAAARRLVTRHYHWCILHDFLPRILSEDALKDSIDQTRLFKSADKGKVPMEFTTAAYRFGHSLISRTYDYNSNFGTGRSMAETAKLGDLFTFTSAGNMKGADQLPDHWVIDWHRMTADSPINLAHSEAIDMQFAGDMMAVVPGEHIVEFQSIVARNLVRGFHRRIPFGQVLAKLCRKTALTADQIRDAMPNALAEDAAYPDTEGELDKRNELAANTPAWLYFLCEAKLLEGGERLGPVASQIIAETFVNLMGLKNGMIKGDDGSPWQPSQSPVKSAESRPIANLRDLLLFATAPKRP